MTTLIDGKKVSSQIRDKISQETAEFIEKTGIQPHLVVIIVGNNPASMTYVRNKKKSSDLWSTHPSTEARIEALRNLK